ncbi:hypothetical protein FDX19_15475 [Citrobacter sp. wls619]|uniref:hypothetical protein n=1 Tax=Citrobacter sp. wls619 TaxID=2576432 RepID=UPI0010C952E3|nr:hypothetical protein [Citrobacter sp. wls619]TKV08236.1 hypothetical protein FDX19_15475 [Citrobacter sp. wls619]
MVFKSIREYGKVRVSTNRSGLIGPVLVLKAYGLAYLSKDVLEGGNYSSARVEVDEELKVIRVRLGEGLECGLSSKGGATFSFPKYLYSVVMGISGGERRIRLEMSEDGWWRGCW